MVEVTVSGAVPVATLETNLEAVVTPVTLSIPKVPTDVNEEFTTAEQAYHYEEHLSLRAEHKQIVSNDFVKSVTISGKYEDCIKRLKEVAKLDFDRISFALLSGGRFRRLEELGQKVVPALREE